MGKERKEWLTLKNATILTAASISLGVFIIGIILISLCKEETIIKDHYVDYTYCKRAASDYELCYSFSETEALPGEICVCYQEFQLNEDLEGNITLYYELETFDQSGENYTKSRDEDQLKGVLKPVPSENCEPFRYDDKNIPIAPCGEIADSFFNDSYFIAVESHKKFYDFTPGVISEEDKKGFSNPPNGKEDMKNFSSPKSWNADFDFWNLDRSNKENNAFQNERFIGWMKTEWKRKPYGRLNTADFPMEGLKKGNYILRVEYNYPAARYYGTRKVIFSAKSTALPVLKHLIGVLVLIIGIISCFGCTAIFLLQIQKQDENARNTSGDNNSNLNPAVVQAEPLLNINRDENALSTSGDNNSNLNTAVAHAESPLNYTNKNEKAQKTSDNDNSIHNPAPAEPLLNGINKDENARNASGDSSPTLNSAVVQAEPLINST